MKKPAGLFLIVMLAACASTSDSGLELYPDTDQAPVLEFFWGPEGLDPTTVIRVTPYGVWEDWVVTDNGILYEPANEMQFYVASKEVPVYAVAPGTVTLVNRDPKGGSITVRYGSDYAVVYHHVVEIPPGLDTGSRVETADIIGYTETRMNNNFDPAVTEAWWEIELNVRRGDTCRTVPPFEYFSAESQQKLQEIMDSKWQGSETSWTVTQGCSWIEYIGPEWWSSGSRLGDFSESESEQEFLEKTGMNWTPGDRYGRILGPTDSCGRF